MDEKREKFLARLRETFRAEAAEHIEGLRAGLVALEHASGTERAAIVERVFREAHSLKGAASSVSLADIEAMCLEMENIFAVMKRQDLRLSADMLDAMHRALAILATRCASPAAAASPEVVQEEQRALQALQSILTGTAGTKAESPAASVAPALPPPPTLPGAATEPSNSRVVAAAPDTVRVEAAKLGAILLEAEELVGAKFAASGRAAELRALAMELARWNQRRIRQGAVQRRSHRGETAVSELLESELLYTRALEKSLHKLAASAQQDALALAASSERLLDDTKQALLVPCSYLLATLPMVLRDLARAQGKEAELVVGGEDIEIDRRVLDELKDPFLHLLRNCVDHAIEKPDARRAAGKPKQGSVTITATPVEGNRVELTVADDGAGVEAGEVIRAAVRLGLVTADEATRLSETEATGLIFHSGLSTSPIITNLSGRGLGLAIVREKVEKLGGTITVASTAGRSTTFRMLVPLSLATFRGVFVAVAGRPFVIPTASVVRVGRVRPDEVRTVENRRVVTFEEHAVALVRLREVLALPGPDGNTNGAARPVVVVRAADRQLAFVVDEVQGEQEVLVKSLGQQLPRVRNVSGACLSSSGAVIPILNAADLVESAGASGAAWSEESEQVPEAGHEQRRRLLIAEDSITARTLVKSILEGAGYEVAATVDGLDALTRLKTESFNLLVSDVDMPRMNGFELTAKVRADKKLAELPVVLVTALGSQKDREYGIEVGANAYIVKNDFDQSNLLEIIARLI